MTSNTLNKFSFLFKIYHILYFYGENAFGHSKLFIGFCTKRKSDNRIFYLNSLTSLPDYVYFNIIECLLASNCFFLPNPFCPLYSKTKKPHRVIFIPSFQFGYYHPQLSITEMIKIYIYKLWKDWWFSAIRHWEGRGLI
jgi:hypothetical protein